MIVKGVQRERLRMVFTQPFKFKIIPIPIKVFYDLFGDVSVRMEIVFKDICIFSSLQK